MIKEELMEALEENECLIANGFDDALIGITMTGEIVAVYSYRKCIEVLMRDMDEEDALEYFSYNVLGAYVGKKTPLFIDDIETSH